MRAYMMYVYIYIYMCVYVSVYGCVREREKERKRVFFVTNKLKKSNEMPKKKLKNQLEINLVKGNSPLRRY